MLSRSSNRSRRFSGLDRDAASGAYFQVERSISHRSRLPIALGFTAGAESRRPLGLAAVGGLFFSRVPTLHITPVFYLYMESLRQFFLISSRHGADLGALEPSVI